MSGRHAAPRPLWRVFASAFLSAFLAGAGVELVALVVLYALRAGSARVG